MSDEQTLKEEIKSRYGQAALQAQRQERRSCCGTGTVLEAGKLDPSPLVTHHKPLDQAAEAYEIYDRREALKIVLTP